MCNTGRRAISTKPRIIQKTSNVTRNYTFCRSKELKVQLITAMADEWRSYNHIWN